MNVNKIKQAKEHLKNNGIFFEEFANGHVKADRVNLWITTEKWYDEVSGEKGVGINSYIQHVKKKGTEF